MTRVKIPLSDLVRINQRLRAAGVRGPMKPLPPQLAVEWCELYLASERNELSRAVLAHGRLLAVFSLVGAGGDPDPEIGTGWYLEVGFGPCEERRPPLFQSWNGALGWARARLTSVPGTL